MKIDDERDGDPILFTYVYKGYFTLIENWRGSFIYLLLDYFFILCTSWVKNRINKLRKLQVVLNNIRFFKCSVQNKLRKEDFKIFNSK